MRYAVISTVVFGAAMFLAPNSNTSATDVHNIIKAPVVQTAQVATKSVPQAKLASSTAAAAPAPQPVILTVTAGDNLTKLAAASGTTYRRLYDANTVIGNPDLIFPGQELRVPAESEVLAARELPVNAPATAVTEAVQAVAPSRTAAPAAAVASGSVWDQLAMCESGGNWAINTGNGFYGGIQFTLATWQGLGGTGYPHQASREEQIAMGEKLLARSGWGQWPACTAKLGLR